MKTYLGISGAIFGIIAVLHIFRLWLDWPAQIGIWAVPLWISWAALFLAGGLCIWAFRLLMASPPSR